ncbi:MAG: HDOD domain-containing protein [Nitrospirae bacterium]|nr:HDOD domain-containing protein [Nitrospirota bacterium]
MQDRRTEIGRIIKDTRSLPTLPGIITKLTALAEDGKVSVNEMARVVSSDQVLSAKVLKLVNSPFYGFSGRISTVSKALILLGVNVVKSLAISSSIFEMMEKNILGLWEHSLGTAVAANIIARRLNLPEWEEISTAALLHDIGKVIIKIRLEKEYDDLLSLIKEKELSMIEAERQLLEIDHAEIGQWLARTWNMPEKLIEPIAFHHNVEKSSAQQVKTAVVHIADVLVKASGFGYSGDGFVPRIQPVAWERLGLNEEILKDIIEDFEDQLIEAKNFSLEIQAKSEPQA